MISENKEPTDIENINEYLANADKEVAAGKNDKAIHDLDRFNNKVDKLKDKGKIYKYTEELVFENTNSDINKLEGLASQISPESTLLN